jgi:ATP-dependent helicase/nuclease subunit A
VTVRVGVAFLGEPSPEPEFLTLPGGLAEAAAPLEQGVRALVRSGMQDEWPCREAAACQALHCGFAEHCHPSPRAC